jgi:hypothetical protein
MRATLAFIFAALLGGCPSNLEEQSHVSKLRVLAVRADPPELVLSADGGLPPAIFTALAVDPSDAGIAVQFALCREITGAPSPTLPCPGDEGIELPPTGPFSARLDLYDPAVAAFAASAQLDGGPYDGGSGLEQTLAEGVPLLIGFTARTASERLDGFANLTLRSDARGPADVNPEVSDLLIGDGGPISTRQVVRLQPLTPAKADPSKAYTFSFFATEGSISSLRSTDTTATGQTAPTWVEWTAPAQPSPAVRFWVVLRDGRGGTAWHEQIVEVH